MSVGGPPEIGKTMLKRMEQYRDRWTSYGANTGIVTISDKPTPEELKTYEIFQDYDNRFLEKISPDVSIAMWKQDSVLFEAGSYIDLAFYLAKGEVEIALQLPDGEEAPEQKPIFEKSAESDAFPPTDGTVILDINKLNETMAPRSGNEITFLANMDFNLPKGGKVKLATGDLFGEIGALSGWPQSVTARTLTDCLLVQVRLPALRMMRRKSKALKQRLDHLYKERSLFSQLKSTRMFQGCDDLFLERMKESVSFVSCDPDEVIVKQGDRVDALYLVRSGFVKLVQRFGEGELVVSYLSKGMTLGEIELMAEGLTTWESTAVSVKYAELVKIPGETFRSVLEQYPEVEERLWEDAGSRIKEIGSSKRQIHRSEFRQAALDLGLVQGNSILVIDLDACTRCDDCVRACAATHGGRPRFVREGHKHRNLLIAKSCYHCRDPVCLVGCPTGAIHRAGVGDVVEIRGDVCIGCSTCSNNCPYDAIVMHETGDVWPGNMVPVGLRGQKRFVASKCDLCHDTGHGPACVSNCPQGCASRVGSLDDFQELLFVKD